VYSFGNVLYTLLTGTIVWEETERQERTSRIIEGNTLPIPAYVKESASYQILANAITFCWTNDAEERPSIFDVVSYLEEAAASQEMNANEFHARSLDMRTMNSHSVSRVRIL
jgi:hypothetical protein